MTYDIRLKRIYEPVEADDGTRILTDRLWPRGLSKDDPRLMQWYRGASPSNELRKRWHQHTINGEAFARLYRQELAQADEVLLPLLQAARRGRLTLLTASRDVAQSHLPTLRQAVLEALTEEDRLTDDDEPSSPTCYGGL